MLPSSSSWRKKRTSSLELESGTIGANESRDVVGGTTSQRGEISPVTSNDESNGIDRYLFNDVEEDPNVSSLSRTTKNSSGWNGI